MKKVFLFFILVSIYSQDDLEKAYLESGNKKKQNVQKEKLKQKLTKKTDQKSEKKNQETKLTKSFWINPDFIKNSNYIPGMENEKITVPSLKEVPAKNVETVKPIETKPEPKKPNPLFAFLTDNVKTILIISSILIFGMWRIFKPSRSEKSSTTVYSKFRKKN